MPIVNHQLYNPEYEISTGYVAPPRVNALSAGSPKCGSQIA